MRQRGPYCYITQVSLTYDLVASVPSVHSFVAILVTITGPNLSHLTFTTKPSYFSGSLFKLQAQPLS